MERKVERRKLKVESEKPRVASIGPGVGGYHALVMNRLLLIALGGAAGSVLRYLVHAAMSPTDGSGFPLGTMTVNVLGCVAIGATAAWVDGDGTAREAWRWLIIVGLLGGFTTFSTFSHDALRLMQREQVGMAAMYMLLTNALCLGGAWLGWRVAQRFIVA
jgi:CrcB protein